VTSNAHSQQKYSIFVTVSIIKRIIYHSLMGETEKISEKFDFCFELSLLIAIEDLSVAYMQ
jgi:hypothetical protein